MIPSHKCIYPFALWCIDTITNLQPPSPTGGTSVIVAIDACSKWIEIGVLDELNSQSTSQFFSD
jgi:hypothetical protein